MHDNCKYWAFISYSHRDKRWGDWLHKAIEHYRVPKHLVGRESRDGKVPHRIFPVFRDREELPTAANLGETIDQALQDSRYLIVICSPNAAASRWVNEEVRAFKLQGKEAQILCLIVDGEPNANEKPGCGLPECFPEAIRFHVDSDGRLTDQRCEPIAADARGDKDGRNNARLKLVAGLLGVGYDELKQRDKQRRRRRWLQAFLASGALLAMTVTVIAFATKSPIAPVAGIVLLGIGTGLWVWQESEKRKQWTWQEEQKAEQARLEFITQNTEQGRRELLEGRPLRAVVHLQEAYAAGGSSSKLLRLLKEAMYPVDARLHTFQEQTVPIAFSRDTARFATTGIDHCVRTWDSGSGTLLHVLKGHSSFVNSVQFSADGSRVVTASDDATARLWDAYSGRQIGSLTHLGQVTAAIFSPDGRRILTTGWIARIWDTQSGALIADLAHPEDLVYYATFNAQGTRIATTSPDMTTRIWNVEDGALLHTLEGHDGTVAFASFSPDGKQLVTAACDSSAKLWDTNGGELVHTFKINSGSTTLVHSAAISPDGTLVMAACETGEAKVWAARSGELVAELAGHSSCKEAMRFHPDGNAILTARSNNPALRWTTNGKLMRTLEGFPVHVEYAVFSQDGEKVLTVANDEKSVGLWDVPRSRMVASTRAAESDQTFRGPEGKPAEPVTKIALAQAYEELGDFDGARQCLEEVVAEGDEEAQARARDHLFRLGNSSTLPTAAALTSPKSPAVTALTSRGRARSVWRDTFSPDGRYGAAVDGDRDGTAFVWRADSGTLVCTLQGHRDTISNLAFSPSGNRIVTASADKTAKVWEVPGGKLGFTLDHAAAVLTAAYSPDGANIVTASADSTARLWSAETGTLLSPPEGHPHTSRMNPRFNLPGTRLFTVHSNGRAQLWDVNTITLVRSLDEQSDVEYVAFSGDGSRVITAGLGSVNLFDTNDGKLVTSFVGHKRHVTHAEISPDGSCLISSGSDRFALLWDLASGALIASLERPFDSIDLGPGVFGEDSEKVVFAGSLGVLVWDVGLEKRESVEIERLVKSRVPWSLKNGTLVAVETG